MGRNNGHRKVNQDLQHAYDHIQVGMTHLKFAEGIIKAAINREKESRREHDEKTE